MRGAIYSSAASLGIDASTISGNSAGDGGPGARGHAGNGGDGANGATSAGIGADGRGSPGGGGGFGGGLKVEGPLTITRSLVSAPSAGHGGDGGDGSGGDGGNMATVNKAAGHGELGAAVMRAPAGLPGGVFAVSAPLTIVNTTVTGNDSGDGGDGGTGELVAMVAAADRCWSRTARVVTARAGDGGAGGNGGGLFIPSGALGHATVSSNHLGGAGGPGTGVGGAPGTGPLPGAAGGKATGGGYPLPNSGGALFVCCGLGSALSLGNSIVTDNDSPSCSATDLGDGGHNVVYPDTSCPGTYADPLLQPLADNGGPTQTRAIGPSSPALDAVPINGGNCADADQRGVTRPRVAGCDSGAFEYALTEATTGDPTGVSDTGATLNGQVVPNGHPTSYHFEYGTTEDYGSSTASQDAGNGVSGVPVTAGVGGLTRPRPTTTAWSQPRGRHGGR